MACKKFAKLVVGPLHFDRYLIIDTPKAAIVI